MNIDSSTQVFLGNTEIVEIRKGNVSIWQKGSTPPPPAPDYLYLENTYEGTNTVSIYTRSSGNPSSSLYSDTVEYSKDKSNWTTLTFTPENTLTISLNQGEKIYFRNNNGKFNYYDDRIVTAYWLNQITTDHSCVAGGNPSSLLDYTNIDNVSLTTGCFSFLFLRNNNLTDISNIILPSTTLAPCCYMNMFRGTSITTPISLPATTIEYSCYRSMYEGCSSLTTVPVLSAMTLTPHCYQSMFYGCTSLTTAPVLAATTLADSCYANMFGGCTSLTTAPTLPATTLLRRSYYQMFQGCSSLNEVTTYANYISAPECISNWLGSVALSGTFNNFGTATWPTNSTSGIPTGWTEYKPDYLYLENTYAGTNTVSIGTSISGVPSSSYYSTTVEYSKDKVNWNTLTLTAGNLENPFTVTLNAGEKLYFRNDNGKFNYEDNGNWLTRITASESNVVGGNIMTLLNYKNVNGTNLIPGCFAYLFRNNNTMTSASNLTLPSSIIKRCYMYTFSNCTALTNPPVLTATTSADNCYAYMFDGDSSLTTAPVLLATYVEPNAYRRMFRNCSSLNEVTTYANFVSLNGTDTWLSGVYTTGTFYNYGSATYRSGASGIPSGWTVVTQ